MYEIIVSDSLHACGSWYLDRDAKLSSSLIMCDDLCRWAPNLDTLSWLLVDRVFMGAFAEPGGPLKVLEYLISMLQLANIDGRVEDATPAAKSMLFNRGGAKQAEAYVQALLKNMNRMIMFCFLPPSINILPEEEPSTPAAEKMKRSDSISEIVEEVSFKNPESASGETGVGCQAILDKATVLQLLLANRKLIFCGINTDLDLVCALCINLFPMAWDSEQSMRSLVVEVWKALLTYRSPALEDVLVTRGIQVKFHVLKFLKSLSICSCTNGLLLRAYIILEVPSDSFVSLVCPCFLDH